MNRNGLSVIDFGAGMSTISSHRALSFIAALVGLATRLDFFIWDEVVLINGNRGIGKLLFPLRSEQAALSEVQEVEHHKHSHAGTFEQVNVDLYNVLGENRLEPRLAALIDFIKDEPANVGQSKEEGYNCISASFSSQTVGDDTLPCKPLSIDSSLSLYKKPDHQQYHQNDLEKKTISCYVLD